MYNTYPDAHPPTELIVEAALHEMTPLLDAPDPAAHEIHYEAAVAVGVG